MPTSARNFDPQGVESLGLDIKSDGLKVIDAAGRLLPEAVEIIAAIKKHDMVLAAGHVTPAETFALMDQCEWIGRKKVIITHALERHVVEEALTRDQIVGWRGAAPISSIASFVACRRTATSSTAPRSSR